MKTQFFPRIIYVLFLLFAFGACNPDVDEDIIESARQLENSEDLEQLKINEDLIDKVNGEKFILKKYGDFHYIHGDLLIPKDQAEPYLDLYRKDLPIEKGARQQVFQAWPNCRVHYKLDSQNPLSSFAWNACLTAMAEVEANTGIEFVYAANLAPRSSYLLIQGGNTNAATIGKTSQSLLIFTASPGTTVSRHEIGHVVGLVHEHQRNDAGAFITYQWQNYTEDPAPDRSIFRPLFNYIPPAPGNPLDFDSAMMYASCAGTDPPGGGCPSWGALMIRTSNNSIWNRGVAFPYSAGDYAAMNILYSNCNSGPGPGPGPGPSPGGDPEE